MCSAAISLTSKALNDVNDAQVLLNIKGRIDLFILTMEVGSLISSCWTLFLNGFSGVGIFCFET